MMKNWLKYLFFVFALCFSNAVFGQFDMNWDTDTDETDSVENIERKREIVQREGGSANRGTVYFFYENLLNVGLPELHFIDTIKSLFHRYDPIMKDNIFRTNRGNVGMITEDLEFVFKDDLLFSYGKNPFELYRFTPFNTKFYQNVDPYVELYYVLGKAREQNFRMLYTQNVYRGLNVGAEYNVILSPGVYNRTFTRHNNVRVFSNFISKDQNYRAVAGYYINNIDVNENGGILVAYDSLNTITDINDKGRIPTRLQQAENRWKENTFYLKQSYHLGINRRVREVREVKKVTEVEHENKDENGDYENGDEHKIESDSLNFTEVIVDSTVNLNIIPKTPRNFGYVSHALEMTKFSTIFEDRNLRAENYPAIFRDSARTFDSTFVELIRNTFSYHIGDVTSYENSHFLNLSVGVTVDLAKVRTGDRILDTTKSDPKEYYKNFNRDFSYFYPFAQLRLNYHDRYFLTAGLKTQMDFDNTHLGTSANLRLDYFFNPFKSNDGVFFEMNFSDVLPRPFQEFYISNSFKWDTTFKNVKTLNLAIGARWKGFRLRSEITTFENYIYLTPTHFEQAPNSFAVFKTSLEKTFRFWKIMALDTRLVYQNTLPITDLPENFAMEFPKFSTRSALYFDFILLGETPVQIGVEGYYNMPYYSRFYNPALGSFYNQNQLEIGGFMFVDAFLNLRVKRANLFFKMSNFGADFLGYNYMMTNGYPVPARAFGFGVLWRFYD